MARSGGAGGVAAFQCSVAREKLAAGDYDGQEYSIRGVSLEGTFEIGVSHRGDGTPPEDILPTAVYESIGEWVRSRADLDVIEARTEPDDWPEIGSCRLTVPGPETVEVHIDCTADGLLERESA